MYEVCTRAIVQYGAPCAFVAHLCFSEDKKKALPALVDFCLLHVCTRLEPAIPPLPNSMPAKCAMSAAFLLCHCMFSRDRHPPWMELGYYGVSGFTLTSLCAPTVSGIRSVRLFGAASWLMGEMARCSYVQDASRILGRQCFFVQHGIVAVADVLEVPFGLIRLLDSTLSAAQSLFFLESLGVPILTNTLSAVYRTLTNS